MDSRSRIDVSMAHIVAGELGTNGGGCVAKGS